MGVYTHTHTCISILFYLCERETLFFNYAVEVFANLIVYWYVHGYEGKKMTVE